MSRLLNAVSTDMIRVDQKPPLDVLKSPVVIAADVISLCADQLAAAIEEASQDVDALTASFLAAVSGDHLTTVEDGLQPIIMEAVTRLQFADRLGQRLNNACRNLHASVEFLRRGDPSSAHSEKAAFLQSVRSSFTMEQERDMFDALFPALTDDFGASAAESNDV